MSDADNVIPFPHGRRPRRSRGKAAGASDKTRRDAPEAPDAPTAGPWGDAAAPGAAGPGAAGQAEEIRAWARENLGLPEDPGEALRALQQMAEYMGVYDDPDAEPGADDDDDGILGAAWARRIAGGAGGASGRRSAPTGLGALDAYGPLVPMPPWGLFDDDDRGRRPELLEPPAEPVAFVVRLDLDGAKPPVWRRLRLAGELTLDRVHEVIQLAMGWTDTHLHRFVMGPKARDWRTEPFLSAYDVAQGDVGVAEADVRLDEVLREPGDRLFYEYDFGDAWNHTLKVERVEPWRPGGRTASCLDGRRACPPENVGGVHGYATILQALAGKVDPEDADWLAEVLSTLPGFDPVAFDAAETDRLLEQAATPLDLRSLNRDLLALIAGVGASPLTTTGRLAARALAAAEPLDAAAADAATSRYRGLLDAVGDGITLTPAGYLPPKLVEALYHGLGLDDEWWGKGNREDQTYPVHALRASATALGLLRKNRGRLLPTKAGHALAGDPAALLRHIADRVPLGRDAERPAGLALLLLAAAGEDPYAARDQAAQVLGEAGWAFTGPNPGSTAYMLAAPTRQVLDALTGPKPAPGVQAAVARALLRR